MCQSAVPSAVEMSISCPSCSRHVYQLSHLKPFSCHDKYFFSRFLLFLLLFFTLPVPLLFRLLLLLLLLLLLPLLLDGPPELPPGPVDAGARRPPPVVDVPVVRVVLPAGGGRHRHLVVQHGADAAHELRVQELPGPLRLEKPN